MIATGLIVWAGWLLWQPGAGAVASETPAERIKITTESGATIALTFRDGGSGAPGVLFFPMCRADAMDGWAVVAKQLQDTGVSSLVMTYPGYGESRQPASATGDQRGLSADAAISYLRSRIGQASPIATAGSSCGVYHALRAAVQNPESVRAVVAFTGPHTASQLEYVRKTSGLAVFSGAAERDGPAPEWAGALREASGHPASRVILAKGKEHGTDVFIEQPMVANEIADWLAARLKASRAGRANAALLF